MTEEEPFSVVKRILFMQVCIVIFVAGVFNLLDGELAARSAALGGLAALLPNGYFALRISRSRGKPARQIVRAMYVGESSKMVLTAIMFAVIFQLPNILFMPLFTGFASVLVVFWFSLLLRSN